MICAGTPNCVIQPRRKAVSQVEAVMSGKGKASTQREPVDDGQKIGVALRGWQGPDKVQIKDLESSAG